MLLLFFVFQAGLYAQVAMIPSGGNVTGSGGSVSYTVGQIAYSTITGAGGSVAQGVQQPFEISVVTALPEAKGISLICTIYPNPVTDKLTLKFENEFPLNYFAWLYDSQGLQIEEIKLVDNETSINMSKLVTGSYFLKVIHLDNEVKTFKIIKN